MLRRTIWLATVVTAWAFFFTSRALAWSDHALATYLALADWPPAREAGLVTVESIASFLAREKERIPDLLEAEEQWDRTHLPFYPPTPAELRFESLAPHHGPEALRARLLRALRINPAIKFPLFLHQFPGAPSHGLPGLPWRRVTILDEAPDDGRSQFLELTEGASVPALDVLASAADEPDYGPDIGLWSDNGTAFGAVYRFGRQPFGNPALSFGSQAPFHMGLFHESDLVYRVAPDVRRCFPEMRIHQFLTLARFAFATGHRYWGWRFLGWGLHYVQDLSQPYHAKALPGVSVPALLGVGLLDSIGFHGPKVRRVQLASNRHLALETYGLDTLFEATRPGRVSSPTIRALSNTAHDARFRAYDDGYPRDVIAALASQKAERADRVIASALPHDWVQDPRFVFDPSKNGINVLAELRQHGSAEANSGMDELFRELMEDFGAHTRRFVGAVVAGASDSGHLH